MDVPGGINPLLFGAQGYRIERSLRFNSADSAYLNRTYSGACQDAKLMTISVWVKRGRLSSSAQYPIFSSYSAVRFGGDLTWKNDTIQFRPGGNGDGASNQYSISTNAVFRDPSAWYHIVVQYDSTQATAANRQKIYVNNVEQSVTGNYPTQNYLHTYAFQNANNQIGGYTSYGTDYLDGLLTEFHFIDGQALTPSSFGETDTITGVWKPKKYAGTYGTNGFYLNFSDNSGTTSTTLGKDSSGNGNNWTPNNFSVTAGAGNDSLIDTPTPYADGGNGRGNYCTGNPLYIPSTQSRMSLTNGNLEWGQAATNVNCSMAGTFEMRSGKWYWEVTVGKSVNYTGLGIQTTTSTAWRGGGTVLYRSDGQKLIGGVNSAYGASYTTNDVIGLAYDADAGSLTCYLNNTSQGVIYSSGTGNTWVPCIHDDNAGSGVTYYHPVNFGQRPFAYTPPSGFVALNTQNLPEPSIKKPANYFDTKLYTGNGTSVTVTGTAFSPDFVWIKRRSTVNSNHVLFDTVRGATKYLISDSTIAEGTDVNSLTAFNSDGFTYGNETSGNANTASYVAWCWDESATPGFDIVTYTGNGVNTRTISHNLGVTPAFFITKNRDGYNNANGFNDWSVYHQNLPAYNTTGSQALYLMSTTNAGAAGGFFTRPTSTVFTPNQTAYDNVSTKTYVAYLWSEVAGFSKFGSYTGNGSSDGPFVFCGFRPKYVLIKYSSGAGGNWVIYDSARIAYNLTSAKLAANSSVQENESASLGDSTFGIDFLSNGFKIRTTGTNHNVSTGTYVFAAFSESPFKYSLAR